MAHEQVASPNEFQNFGHYAIQPSFRRAHGHCIDSSNYVYLELLILIDPKQKLEITIGGSRFGD